MDDTVNGKIASAITLDEMRSVIDGLDMMVFMADLVSRKMIFMSAGCETIYGVPAEAFYDNPDLWLTFFPPDEKEAVANVMQEWSKGKSTTAVHRIIRADGGVRWVEARTVPIVDAHGTAIRITGFLTDITEEWLSTELAIKNASRYKLLFNNMLEGLASCEMIYDGSGKPVDFRYLEVNPMFETLTGLKGVTGKLITEMIPNIRESNPELFEIYERVISTGKPEKFETYIDSLRLWLSISVYSTTKGFFTTVFANITSQKVTEESLRSSKNELSFAIKLAKMAPWKFDVQKNLFIFGDEFYSLYGTSVAEEGPTMTPEAYVKKFVHPDDAALVGQGIGEAIRATEREFSSTIESRIVRKDGSIRFVTVFFKVLKDADGNITEWYGVNQDITDRKAMEEALRSSEEELSLAVELANIAPWKFDPQKNVFIFGKEFYALYGTSVAEEGPTMTPEVFAKKFVHPDSQSIVGEEISKAIQSAERQYSVSLEAWVIRKDGGIRLHTVVFRVLKDANGNIVDWYGVNQDITEQRQQKLHIEELSDLRKKFIQIVSHQLRTPLGSIRWNLELLMDGSMGVLTDAQKQFLHVTYNADVEVLDRINDLLIAMDIEEGRIAFMKDDISIESLLGSIIIEKKMRCEAKEIVCDFHMPEAPLGSVFVDPEKMRQVFVKLIDNAISYTPEKGHIGCSLSKVGDMIRFEITDTGIGIPAAEQKNMFTSFFRGTNAFLAKPDSSGLGLSIVKYFVEQHGGKVGFTSEEGKGSTFWFEIPVIHV